MSPGNSPCTSLSLGNRVLLRATVAASTRASSRLPPASRTTQSTNTRQQYRCGMTQRDFVLMARADDKILHQRGGRRVWGSERRRSAVSIACVPEIRRGPPTKIIIRPSSIRATYAVSCVDSSAFSSLELFPRSWFEPNPQLSTLHESVPTSGAPASGCASSSLTAARTSVPPVTSVTREEPFACGSSPASATRLLRRRNDESRRAQTESFV